jgi:hypothetical protein
MRCNERLSAILGDIHQQPNDIHQQKMKFVRRERYSSISFDFRPSKTMIVQEGQMSSKMVDFTRR